MSLRRSHHSPRPTDSIVKQVEAAEKVLSFAKLILGAFAALLLWAARLQWNVADLQTRVAEIQEDRRAKIEKADAWRHDVDLANVHRDEALAALAKAQTLQAAQVEGARAARAR